LAASLRNRLVERADMDLQALGLGLAQSVIGEQGQRSEPSDLSVIAYVIAIL
jgi:hypothetical protein